MKAFIFKTWFLMQTMDLFLMSRTLKHSKRPNEFYNWLRGRQNSEGSNRGILHDVLRERRQAVTVSTPRPSTKPTTGIKMPSVPLMTPPRLPSTVTVSASRPSMKPTTGIKMPSVPNMTPPRLPSTVKVPTSARPSTLKPTSKQLSKSQNQISTTHTPVPAKDPHVNVPEPFDVVPVQTVPAQKYLATVPTKGVQDSGERVSNRTHALLPHLPVFNVSLPTQSDLPVAPVRNVSQHKVLAGEMAPDPVPVMTRPTVTVLQHVIGSRPTQATLQSVVVPKRKEVAPPSPLPPLGVLPPHTVPTPMPQLKQLQPIPPIEPVIIHHVPPKECDCDPCSSSCGCGTSCGGR